MAETMMSKERSVASAGLPPLPERRIIVLGGGNAGNALTCTARLGLAPRLISKVANDAHGMNILAELEADGVDTSHVKISEGGTSTFTYVIVDNQTKTRTCISTPGCPAMVPDDLPRSSILSALNEARLIYFDGRSHRTALVVAQEAAQMNIPILIDVEKKKSGLDGLLNLASYVICSENFPQAWTSVPSIPSALVSILLKLPRIKFVIVTLGENGCIMIERTTGGKDPKIDAIDVERLAEKLRIDRSSILPTCISSKSAMKLCANGIGTVRGRLILGTAESIPSSELVDTTGAGDAFIGAVLYGMPPEKMLPFAAQVAAMGCRAMGARTGLPQRTDPRLAPFLD